MTDNVLALTEASAMLNICFESTSYKDLSTEKAIELSKLGTRITDLVQKIANYYDADALYLTYELMRVKLSSQKKTKEYSRQKYHYCGDKLFNEMETYITENEQLISSFLSKPKKTDKNTIWPKTAKRLYIERCSSSLKSQGVAYKYSRPYCSCLTDEMEKEFGMAEYENMMKAHPNPSGSEYDKRLYKVFSSCRYILPR